MWMTDTEGVFVNMENIVRLFISENATNDEKSKGLTRYTIEAHEEQAWEEPWVYYFGDFATKEEVEQEFEKLKSILISKQ